MCPASSTVSSLPAWTSSRAVDRGVQVRRLLGEPVAGVLVERAVHAHAVAPGDEVGVRLRAPGLDALGHAAAQRIAPDELLDGLGPHLQGEGVIDRQEVQIRDRVHDRRRLENGQRSVGPKTRSSGLMSETTAGVDASKGLSSITLTS